MAINEIQVARYNKLLHQLLSMKEGAPAPTLVPEIGAELVLQADRPEWSYLADEHLMAGYATSGPSVGNTPKTQLYNPLGSGVLAVVEAISAWCTTTTALRVGLTSGSGVFTGTQANNQRGPRDPRRGYASPVCELREQNTTSINPTQDVYYLIVPSAIALVGYVVPIVPLILIAGVAVTVWGHTATTDITVQYLWRERAIESSELR